MVQFYLVRIDEVNLKSNTQDFGHPLLFYLLTLVTTRKSIMFFLAVLLLLLLFFFLSIAKLYVFFFAFYCWFFLKLTQSELRVCGKFVLDQVVNSL